MKYEQTGQGESYYHSILNEAVRMLDQNREKEAVEKVKQVL